MNEAEASCCLDGDTMDCSKCKSQIEKDVAKRIFERIEEDEAMILASDKYVCISRQDWQQLRQEYGI